MGNSLLNRHFVHRFKAMGSPCEIQTFADSQAKSEELNAQLQAEVERLEQKYSRYREASFLSEINRVAAEGGSIEVDNETAQILNYAAACYVQSDGLFDVTSGVLRRAWDFKSGKAPDAGMLSSLAGRIGWDKVEWDGKRLRFAVREMELDFGGIVKEYAVDCCARLCIEAALRNTVINLGGDIHVVGPRGDGTAWAVGIRHPRRSDDVARIVHLNRGALATSGDYERCLMINGKRFGHILNPKTGWPTTVMASVSVIADRCVVAGSASTIGMLKDKAGAVWLASLGLPYIWVGTDGSQGGNLGEQNRYSPFSAQRN